MRSPSLRHVIHLRVSIVDAHPTVERHIVVDRELSLAELRHVVQATLESPACSHHLFTDTLEGPRWSHSRRRWGDRWTMIDFRDPTVIDEMTARVGSVMRDTHRIYFAHTCDSNWVVEIEAGPDDIVPATEPRVGIVAGEGRAPFACSRGPYEHDVLLGVLEDPEHALHDALRAHIEFAVGPWATFDPSRFDRAEAQSSLDAMLSGDRTTGADSLLGTTVVMMPGLARRGFIEHIAAAGLDLPVVVTVDEAAHLTREFRWLLDRVRQGDVRVIDGMLEPRVAGEAAAALQRGSDHVQRLFSTTRQLRLVYSRNGYLIVKKSVSAVASAPVSLWTLLADSMLTLARRRGSRAAADLLLLAIADSTLDDSAVGLSRVAHAFALISSRERGEWGYSSGYGSAYGGRYESGYGYGYGDGHGYEQGFDGDYSRGYQNDSGCEQRCDCPSINGATWHDVVAYAIRDATRRAASDGAVAVAAREDAYEVGARPEFSGMRPEWIAYATEREILPEAVDGLATRLAHAESELLSETADLIELLSLFGLVRSDDGGWVVPSSLREFVRATLQRRGTTRAWGSGRGGFASDAHPF